MTYTITATLKDANNWYVKVVDYLPAGVTYVSSSPSGSYNSGTNTVTWTFGPVAQNVPKVMTVTVIPTSANTYKNSVKTWIKSCSGCSWGTMQPYDNLVTTTAKPCFTEITKTASERDCTMQDLTYGLHVSYTGLDNQNIVVSDLLPGGVTFVSASDSGTNNAGTVTWNFGPVTNGWSKDLTIVVNPGSEGTLTNSATSSVTGLTSPPATSNTVLTEIATCESTPEFPTMAIPAVALIGLVLIAGYLKRKDL